MLTAAEDDPVGEATRATCVCVQVVRARRFPAAASVPPLELSDTRPWGEIIVVSMVSEAGRPALLHPRRGGPSNQISIAGTAATKIRSGARKSVSDFLAPEYDPAFFKRAIGAIVQNWRRSDSAGWMGIVGHTRMGHVS